MGNDVTISLRETVGRGYKTFWNYKGRYRAVKGSRASKKSKTAALNMIYRLIQYPLSNGLCIRRYQNTLRDSCFADLQWAIHRLHLDDYFDCSVSPMQIVRKNTKQKILFRGLDDGLKVTSISVPKGVLCWVWVEEAYEIEEADFNKLDMSIRGAVPDGYFKQITLTFNPWSECWLKTRFFDVESDNILAMTTTWQCNEWIDEADKRLFLEMQVKEPDRYRVEGAGEWGVVGDVYFKEFRTDVHVIDPVMIYKDWRKYISIDYGLDRLAVLWHAIDSNGNVFTYREYCESDLIISEAVSKIIEYTGKEKIYALLAPPDLWGRSQETGKSRAIIFNEEFRKQGSTLYLSKSNNDREAGWLSIKELLKVEQKRNEVYGYITETSKWHIFRNCKELIKCLPALQIDPKHPTDTMNEPHEITHAPDAMRYFAIYWLHPADMPSEDRVYYRPDILADYMRASAEQKLMIEKKMGGKPK